MEVISPPGRARSQGPQEHKESTAKSWIVVFSIAFFFFFWGLFIFYTVGAGRSPSWRYGKMPDVPGQSVYSVQGAEERAGTAMMGRKVIRKQHIMGGPEENASHQGRKGL